MLGNVAIRVLMASGAALLMVGCSSPSEPAATDPEKASTAVPIVTVVEPRFERHWTPAQDPGDAEAEIADALEAADAVILIPEQLPPEVSDSRGRLTIAQTVPGGTVLVDLFVSFLQDGEEVGISLKRSADGPDCHDRIATGERGISGWEAITVRGSDGCAVTNEAGLGFTEWNEGSSRFHVETFMDLQEAVSWLSEWEVVP